MIYGGIEGGVTNDNYAYLIDMLSSFEKSGTRLVRLSRRSRNRLMGLLLEALFVIRALFFIAGKKFDIIHCQSPNTTFIPWLLGKAFIATVHSEYLRPNPKYKIPNKLIAVSTESKRFGVEVLGSDPRHVPIVCHGISSRFSEEVDKDRLRSIRAKYGIDENKIVIGHIGRLTPTKGLQTIIEAIELLPIEQIANIQVIFMGDFYYSEDKFWFNNLIKSTPLKEQIVVMPFQDPQPVYKLIDVFVLASTKETFGLVAVEAMMSGCCTIRSDSAGATDQIEHGVDGFIFPMEDSNSLKRILSDVIQNDDIRKMISVNGREKALNSFTYEIMAQKTLEVYQSIL
jgi:glycosyltransferase involved in cell wall biosynthesis